MYEMLVGRPPFMSNDPMDLFQMALNEKIKFPKDFDSKAKSLIKKLANKDLSSRYGNLHGGVKDIKDHRFFKDFSWDKILKCNKADAPYLPPTKNFKSEKLVYFDDLEECSDFKTYPSIKPIKDPFLTFF